MRKNIQLICSIYKFTNRFKYSKDTDIHLQLYKVQYNVYLWMIRIALKMLIWDIGSFLYELVLSQKDTYSINNKELYFARNWYQYFMLNLLIDTKVL